jgi:transposase
LVCDWFVVDQNGLQIPLSEAPSLWQILTARSNCSQLLVYTANLPAALIGMEDEVGSHFLGRALREQGHQVRLIPAQFVRPFVKSNKNDYRDAEAEALVYHQSLRGWLDTIQGDARARILRHRCRISNPSL